MAPVLVEATRGGIVESRHRGSLVLLDSAGQVSASLGPHAAPIYPRSSLKPFQAAAMVSAGFRTGYFLDDRALALAAASHAGEPMHVVGVRAILASEGLAESALQCPAELPGDQATLVSHLRGGGGPERVLHNCSGKHAAMLATSAAAGWDVGGYRENDHPLQQAIAAAVAHYAGEPVAAVTVDGCGAPAYAISLLGLARAYSALLCASAGEPTALVRDAMRAYPWLVSGTGRPVTELMAGVPGLLCKDGAEGVWAAGLPDGRACALKIDDGNGRAAPVVLAAVLRHWGIDAPIVAQWSQVEIRGGDVVVGVLRCSAEMRDMGVDE